MDAGKHSEEHGGVEPKPEDPDRRRRFFFLEAPLRAGFGLSEATGLDETTYRSVAGHALQNNRGYYHYGVIDEVVKATVAIRRWVDYLSNPDRMDGGGDKHFARVVVESLLDEQKLWTRKLIELLCDLILFQSTNSQEYYRLYLLCQELDAYLRLQDDCDEFFECQSLNAKSTINSLVGEIQRLSKTIDLKNVWFLKPGLKLTKLPSAGQLFSSARSRFKLALKQGTPDERIAIGLNYDKAFGFSSRSIHPSIGVPGAEERSLNDIDKGIGHVGMIALQVILLSRKLLDLAPQGFAEEWEKIRSAADAVVALQSVYGKEFEIGDIVYAYSLDLCQVLDKKKSKYGYTSYKVRYLLTPPLPEVPEDWFPARFVHLVWPCKGLREGIAQIYAEAGVSEDVLAKLRDMPDEELNAHMVRTIIPLHQSGELARFMGAHPRQPSDSTNKYVGTFLLGSYQWAN